MKMDLAKKYARLPLWLWLTLLVFAAGGGIAWLVAQPQHAGWRYGACKVFLEQYVRFPTTLQIKQGGETRGTAVLAFTDINPFGAQQMRMFECHFSTDNAGRTTLSRITLDRKAIPEDEVKKYAAQLRLLAGQELDTALPQDIPAKLEDLKE